MGEKLMTAPEIAAKVGQGMTTNDVFNFMKNREALRIIPRTNKNGRIFFEISPWRMKTITKLWLEVLKLKKHLSTTDMAKWLISQGCPICQEDLTRLARKGAIPVTRIGWFWAFSPEQKEKILNIIKSRKAQSETEN